MYRKIVILILIAFSFVLSGCKDEPELVEPYDMTNEIIETMIGKTDEGIYEISGSKDQFIIYRGVEKGIETMTYSVEDNMLVFLFETVELSESKDYVYKVRLDSSYDTIQVLIDGEIEAFKTVFVQ
ncbi:MAG TPA: hypothetical protein VLM88_05460 [Proteiniclasticum sp.]|nr:hypothetical protein [Proteiniclasticum sp.]